MAFDKYFESSLGAPAQARFKLKLFYADKNGNGRFDRFVDEFEGADVVKAEPFRWLSRAKSAE